MVYSGKNDRFWIGMNRVGSNGDFMWTDQTAVEFTHWDHGQPSDGQLDNCVVMSETTGRWSSVLCDSMFNWVCKLHRGECAHGQSFIYSQVAVPKIKNISDPDTTSG